MLVAAVRRILFLVSMLINQVRLSAIRSERPPRLLRDVATQIPSGPFHLSIDRTFCPYPGFSSSQRLGVARRWTDSRFHVQKVFLLETVYGRYSVALDDPMLGGKDWRSWTADVV